MQREHEINGTIPTAAPMDRSMSAGSIYGFIVRTTRHALLQNLVMHKTAQDSKPSNTLVNPRTCIICYHPAASRVLKDLKCPI